MKKRTLGRILQIPTWILLIAIAIGFIYLSVTGYADQPGKSFIKYEVAVWIILLLYLIGRIMTQGKSEDFPSF